MKLRRLLPVLFLFVFMSGLSVSTTSCKWMAKTAAKHWTRKQKKKFIAKCKEGAIAKFSARSNEICKCMASVAEEKFPKAEDAMSMGWLQLVKMAGDCLK